MAPFFSQTPAGQAKQIGLITAAPAPALSRQPGLVGPLETRETGGMKLPLDPTLLPPLPCGDHQPCCLAVTS